MDTYTLNSVEPSESFLFLQALRRAKEASLKEAETQDAGRKRLEQRVAQFNLRVNEDTDAEGDCQFDSVADQLVALGKHGASLTKEEVRRSTIDWLRRNPDYRLSDDPTNPDTLSSWIRDTQGLEWGVYLDGMAKAKAWGDEVTLKGIVETYQVRILLFSSTVSADNYFSVHRPKGDAGDSTDVPSICMCHFLEVHYGSLLTSLEFNRRRNAKRMQLFRLLESLPAEKQLELLCDVFLLDNMRVAKNIDRFSVATAVTQHKGNSREAFEALERAVSQGAAESVISIPLRRLLQYGVSKESVVVAVSQTSSREDQQLSMALALVKELREENTTFKNEIARLKKQLEALEAAKVHDTATAPPAVAAAVSPAISRSPAVPRSPTLCPISFAEHTLVPAPLVTKDDEPKPDPLTVSFVTDEEGKKWLRLAWNLTGHPVEPLVGDMLSLQRLAMYGTAAQTLQKQPSPGGVTGAVLFEVPTTIGHYCLQSSRKGNRLLATAVFLVGPQIKLNLVSWVGNRLTVSWEWTRTDHTAAAPTTRDWIGVYRKDESSMGKYETYATIKPDSSVVTLMLSEEPKRPYVVRYFCGDNKYYPVAEMDVETKA